MALLKEKFFESLSSVLPISAIVLLLCITIAPVSTGVFVLFLLGAFMLIFGMSLFTLGAELSMQPMGEGIGVVISKKKKIVFPLVILAPDSIKEEIMNAVNTEHGLRTEAQGMVCSLPVDKAFKI